MLKSYSMSNVPGKIIDSYLTMKIPNKFSCLWSYLKCTICMFTCKCGAESTFQSENIWNFLNWWRNKSAEICDCLFDGLFFTLTVRVILVIGWQYDVKQNVNDGLKIFGCCTNKIWLFGFMLLMSSYQNSRIIKKINSIETPAPPLILLSWYSW